MNARQIGWIGLFLALAVVLFLSPWSSPYPDGLEWAAQEAGFQNKAKAAMEEGLLRPTRLGGLIGVLLVFGLSLGLGKFLRPAGRAVWTKRR